MTRITNSLFESIRQVTHPVIAETKAEGGGRVDGAHYCATHVEHSLYGEGECIAEQHAAPNADGTIDWYNVKFADGQVRKIQTEAVKVKKAKMHEHATPEGDTIEEKKLDPVGKEDADIDNNGKVDKSDDYLKNRRKAISAAIKEEEQIDEAGMSHQASTTMKHIPNASPALKKAAKDIKPGIAGYKDRIDMLKAGGVKEEAEEVEENTLSAKAGRAGADLGAPGKNFSKISKAAAKRYGSKAAGERVAGAVLAKMRKEEVELEESVTETIVKHNDFTIEITDNPTFGDFLKAVQSIVRTDEEAFQKEIVAIAEQAFAENYEDIIIEAFTRMDIDDKMNAHRKAGNTVSNDKFSTKNGQPYAEYVVTDKEGGRKKYIHHGTVRRMESMPSVTKKDKE